MRSDFAKLKAEGKRVIDLFYTVRLTRSQKFDCDVYDGAILHHHRGTQYKSEHEHEYVYRYAGNVERINS